MSPVRRSRSRTIPASVAALGEGFVKWLSRQQMPGFLAKLLLRLAARRSRLVRILFMSDQGYLDSITTYVLKLGPDHLPPGFDSPMDRRIADTPHAPLLRLGCNRSPSSWPRRCENH